MRGFARRRCQRIIFTLSFVAGAAGAAHAQTSIGGIDDRPSAVGQEARAVSEDDLNPKINAKAASMHGIDDLRKTYRNQFRGGDLDGSGVLVGVWDGGQILRTHQSFNGRVSIVDAAYAPSFHATHVAGTIAARADNDFKPARGVASGVDLMSFDFCEQPKNTPEEMKTAAAEYADLSIVNHSWGLPRHGYSTFTSEFDAALWDHPNLVAFVAAGNERNADANAKRRFVSGSSSLVKNWTAPYGFLRDPASSKNAITVGAMVGLRKHQDVLKNRRLIKAAEFSNWGPTADGRIKPDIIANGLKLISPSSFGESTKDGRYECWVASDEIEINTCQEVREGGRNQDECYKTLDGTSMATPVMSGLGALLQQIASKALGRFLRADEMKAILIQGAASPKNLPSYQTGWGAVHAPTAAKYVEAWKDTFDPDEHGVVFTRARVSEQSPVIHRVRRHGADAVRITIAWLDTPGETLVHDVDLKLVSLNGEDDFLPWTLDPRRPNRRAERGVNSHDNVERINISRKEEMGGDWELSVALKGAPGPVEVAIVSRGLERIP